MEQALPPPDSAPRIETRPAAKRGGRYWLAATLYAARVAAAVAILLIWTIQGLIPAWATWQAAARTPAAPRSAYDAGRLTLDAATLYTLLAAARTACPPARPVLALSDDVRAVQQGNYVLYPRRVDPVHQADPFGPADLATHSGGCLFTYGPTTSRLDPYRAQLTERTCSPDGCLYQIKDP